jgi:riboflavin synthase
MFTGIVEETGTIRAAEPRGEGVRLTVACKGVIEDAMLGSSIAVNGVCLTAVALGPGWFAADLAPETLRRTNLGKLVPGSVVNLERPLPFNGRVGGHLVQGHVESTASLLALEPLGNGNWWLRVGLPEGAARYVVEKGSIALDGISLTVALVEGTTVSAAIIPHTYENTNLHTLQPGWPMNLETDIIAKHIEKLLPPSR